MNENPYMMLAKVILPKEMTEYFDLTKVRTDEYNGEPRIHLYLDEKNKVRRGIMLIPRWANLRASGTIDSVISRNESKRLITA